MTQPAKKNINPSKKLTERPQGKGLRLTLPEKLLIRSHKGHKPSREIAREYGVSKTTVLNIWANEELAARTEDIAVVKEGLASKYYGLADMAAEQVADKIDNTSASQAAVIVGIMTQNARLLDNLSTSNVSVQGYIGLCNDVPIDESIK